MLTVLPIQSKIEQEAICARCGVPFRETCMAYAANVDEKLVGICQFYLDRDGGHITDFAAHVPEGEQQDNEALFIMARGCLNFIDLCGIHTAFFESDFPDSDLIHAIGFRTDDKGRRTIDLEGFFDHPCQHDKHTN